MPVNIVPTQPVKPTPFRLETVKAQAAPVHLAVTVLAHLVQAEAGEAAAQVAVAPEEAGKFSNSATIISPR